MPFNVASLVKLNSIPMALAQEKSKAFWALGKPNITFFILGTTLAGFSLANPNPVDNYVLLTTIVGTGLSSISANSFNQWKEGSFDALMSRTRFRPIPTGKLTYREALTFATGAGIMGITTLLTVNSLAPALSLATIILYAGIYTPLKRITTWNTWIGSIVGAIPPLIGYAAATGTVLSIDALILPAILFSWQFPHFCSLSWNLKSDYLKAGYRMMAVEQPKRNVQTSLGFSCILPIICFTSTFIGFTEPLFAFTSSIANLPLIALSYSFYKSSERKTARRLFLYSLIHLPLLMFFLIYNRKRNPKHDKSILLDDTNI
jgi:heme o synthase